MLIVYLLLGYGTAWTQVPHPEDPGKQEQTAEPTAALCSAVDLETTKIHKTTADYRQQPKRLENEARTQEQRNAWLKQDIAWLVSLVEKYSSGDGIAQRLAAWLAVSAPSQGMVEESHLVQLSPWYDTSGIPSYV
jgi:hypothetical protein